jgi:predicted nuclease with TOPRIM domain
MSTETKELQTKLDLEIAEKDTLTKEVEDLKAEIEKLKAEATKDEEPKAELSKIEKLSKVIEDLSVRLAEVEKKPAIETVEKDLTKLSYEDRMWILHNKQN